MNNKTIIWIIIGVVIAAVLGFFWFRISVKNRLVLMDEEVNGAWHEIDVQLVRRVETIPALLNTVKLQAAHETEVIALITKARGQLAGARTPSEKASANQQLDSALSRLLVLQENNPQLKANEDYLRLMDEIAGTNNRITVARSRYNQAVKLLNTEIRTFPGNLFADSLNLKPREYFESEVLDRKTMETMPEIK